MFELWKVYYRIIYQTKVSLQNINEIRIVSLFKSFIMKFLNKILSFTQYNILKNIIQYKIYIIQYKNIIQYFKK